MNAVVSAEQLQLLTLLVVDQLRLEQRLGDNVNRQNVGLSFALADTSSATFASCRNASTIFDVSDKM